MQDRSGKRSQDSQQDLSASAQAMIRLSRQARERGAAKCHAIEKDLDVTSHAIIAEISHRISPFWIFKKGHFFAFHNNFAGHQAKEYDPVPALCCYFRTRHQQSGPGLRTSSDGN
jgi:hypothetical protein